MSTTIFENIICDFLKCHGAETFKNTAGAYVRETAHPTKGLKANIYYGDACDWITLRVNSDNGVFELDFIEEDESKHIYITRESEKIAAFSCHNGSIKNTTYDNNLMNDFVKECPKLLSLMIDAIIAKKEEQAKQMEEQLNCKERE